jgi:DNA-binding response OmpR family regulator
VVLDWDEASLSGPEVCAAARALPHTCVLVTTGDVRQAPAILRAGCHGVLLKPFAPNLLAARLARVIKETDRPWGQRSGTLPWQTGTNRVWPETACLACGKLGATSFDFSSYRRVWYACLSCDHTWLGRRQE